MANPGPDPRELLDDGLRYEKAGMADRALACYQQAREHADEPALLSEALRRQAHVYRVRCEWDLALDAAERSAAVAADAGLTELVAESWNAEAAVHQSVGDYDAAVPIYNRILEAVPVGRIRAVALQNLAAISATRGRLEEARQHFEAAYTAFADAGDSWGVAYVLNNLGRLALDQRDPAKAEQTLEQAILLAREINDLELLAIARVNYAEALFARGELRKAEQEASAALGHFGAAENRWRRIECMRLLGDIALHREETEAARRFFQAGLSIAEEIGAKLERDQLYLRLARMEPEG